MTLQVEIGKQNTEQIISAIKLLKGVKSVSEQGRRVFKEVKESKADREAWIKARRDLAAGKTISHEDLKRELGL